MDDIKIYLAAPIVGISDDWKDRITTVRQILKYTFKNVYDPSEHGVPNAWGMTMEEWSKCIFALDVVAIDNCDWVVVCDFGRDNTAGTAWEVGYAFGKDKKILIIKMADDNMNYSVMMNGCSSNSISFEKFTNQKAFDDISNIFVERGKLQSEEVFN